MRKMTTVHIINTNTASAHLHLLYNFAPFEAIFLRQNAQNFKVKNRVSPVIVLVVRCFKIQSRPREQQTALFCLHNSDVDVVLSNGDRLPALSATMLSGCHMDNIIL